MQSFHRFGLHANLVSHLASLGVTKPTPVQTSAISAVIRRLPQDDDDPKWSFGREALVIDSATGSGKTLAYLLPLADLVLKSARNAAAVAAPSATLAAQIRDQAADLIGPDRVELVDSSNEIANPNASIFIGMLKPLSRLPAPVLDRLKCVILDEADMILKPAGKYETFRRGRIRAPKRQEALQALHHLMGGEEKAPTQTLAEEDDDDDDDGIKWIGDIQDSCRAGSGVSPLVVAVSATANNRLRHVLKVSKIVHGVKILSPSNKPFDLPLGLLHRYHAVEYDQDERREIGVGRALANLFRHYGEKPTMTVTPDAFSLDMLRASLEYEGVKVAVIDEIVPSDLPHFKNAFDGSEILLGSSRAIRGLDVPSVEHVFIVDVPETTKDYVHIAGRTARMGRSGTVTTFSPSRDLERLRGFVKELGVEFEPVRIESKPNA